MNGLLELKKQMEIDFLKSKTYPEINEMFNELNDKLNIANSKVKKLNLLDANKRFSDAVEDIDSNGLECGIEDVGITNRYEAMQYGFDQCKERALEAITLV